MLNDQGAFDEEPVRCITSDGVVYKIIGVMRDVDYNEESPSVWFQIQEED